MILKIKYNDNGYYITVDDERITDYTKFKPKKDAIIIDFVLLFTTIYIAQPQAPLSPA